MSIPTNTVDQLSAYAVARGYDPIDETKGNILLTKAGDIISLLPLCATLTDSQAINVKKAINEIALQINNGFDPSAPVTKSSIKKEKVDSLEVEYFDNQISNVDHISLIKSFPIAYQLVSTAFCSKTVQGEILRA